MRVVVVSRFRLRRRLVMGVAMVAAVVFVVWKMVVVFRVLLWW